MKVVVNSAQRVSGSQENYLFQAAFEQKDIRTLTLLQAIVPKTTYNITEANNTFTIESTLVPSPPNVAVLLSVVLPVGVHTGISIAAYITGALAAGGANFTGFTCTFLPSTGVLHYVHDGTGGPFLMRFYAATKDAARVFGLPNDPQSNSLVPPYMTPVSLEDGTEQFWSTASPTIYYMPNVSQLNYPDYLICDVDVTQGAGQDMMTDGNRHSFIVPLNVEQGEIKNFTAANAYPQTDKLQELNLLTFRVRFLPPEKPFNDTFSFRGADHILVFDAQ